MNTETSSTRSAPAAASHSHAPAIQSEPGFALDRPAPRIARHVERHMSWVVPATPETVFPLLCPTREYDWIDGWHARLIHSASGGAEDHCIFETRIAPFGSMIWVCTRFEPPKHIEYTNFSERGVVVRLRITLCQRANDTTILWDRSWHALNPAGEALLAGWSDAAYDAMMEHHRVEMDHYLRTGTLAGSAA